MKKHYKLSSVERAQHDMAVKIRKMTDAQICEFIDELQNQNRSVDCFLNHLSCMSGTGNGLGQATVAKIKEFAQKEGYAKYENHN